MKAKEMIPLATFQEVLAYEPETGRFLWKGRRPRAARSEIAGSSCGRYLQVQVCGYVYLQHRLAWFFSYGVWPSNQIDHIDRDRTNNRISNLRDVDAVVNNQNKIAASAGKAIPLRGVKQSSPGRFSAQIKGRDGSKHLGTFDTAYEAHAAYLAAKRQLHEGCTI